MDFFNTTFETDKTMAGTPQIAPKQTASSKSVQNKTAATSTQSTSRMTVNLKVENPDIILVEHMDNIDTSAIILHVSTIFMIFMVFENEK